MASLIIAQLLFLECENPKKDISMYINSPGGVVTAGMAIHDTMQYIRPKVAPCASARPPRWAASCSRPASRACAWRCPTPDHGPPAVGRRAGHGLGHRDPGPRDPAHARADERALRQVYRPGDRGDREGDGPRQVPRGRRGEGFGIVDKVFDKRPEQGEDAGPAPETSRRPRVRAGRAGERHDRRSPASDRSMSCRCASGASCLLPPRYGCGATARQKIALCRGSYAPPIDIFARPCRVYLGNPYSGQERSIGRALTAKLD